MLAKLSLSLLAIAVIGVGCSSQQPVAPDSSQAQTNADASTAVSRLDHHLFGHQVQMTFKVRIENVSTATTLHLSNGETAPAPHSPGVWAITGLWNPFFRVGQYDRGEGLEQQAEDGNPAVLAGNIVNDSRVKSSGAFTIPVGDSSPGPATPGKAFEFMVTASPGDHLSLTTMFGQSNDLFYSPGNIGIPLFQRRRIPTSGDVTRYFSLWDAGTEVNQEPGLGADQAPRQSAPNTGESEHRRIMKVHDQYTYPRTSDVIKVTITPMDNVS